VKFRRALSRPPVPSRTAVEKAIGAAHGPPRHEAPLRRRAVGHSRAPWSVVFALPVKRKAAERASLDPHTSVVHSCCDRGCSPAARTAYETPVIPIFVDELGCASPASSRLRTAVAGDGSMLELFDETAVPMDGPLTRVPRSGPKPVSRAPSAQVLGSATTGELDVFPKL
jgi:hypothetical protein